jgi:hypothetical protein
MRSGKWGGEGLRSLQEDGLEGVQGGQPGVLELLQVFGLAPGSSTVRQMTVPAHAARRCQLRYVQQPLAS